MGFFLEKFGCTDEIIQSQSFVGFSVPCPLAPVRVMTPIRGAGMQVPKSIHEACVELGLKRGSFFRSDTGLFSQVFGTVVLDFQIRVCYIQISEPQNGLDFVFGLRKTQKILVPFLGTIIQTFQFLARIGYVDIDQGKEREIDSDYTAFGIVRWFTHFKRNILGDEILDINGNVGRI